MYKFIAQPASSFYGKTRRDLFSSPLIARSHARLSHDGVAMAGQDRRFY